MKLEELGLKIQQLRKKKGWSQQDLESYSGITNANLPALEFYLKTI